MRRRIVCKISKIFAPIIVRLKRKSSYTWDIKTRAWVYWRDERKSSVASNPWQTAGGIGIARCNTKVSQTVFSRLKCFAGYLCHLSLQDKFNKQPRLIGCMSKTPGVAERNNNVAQKEKDLLYYGCFWCFFYTTKKRILYFARTTNYCNDF